MSRPKILCFVGYYLPGYKAGGVLRTISNLVDHLSDEFEFLIVTRDRDLGDGQPYPSIESGRWLRNDRFSIYYCSDAELSFFNLRRLLSEVPHDLVYLNSFFDFFFSIKILTIRAFFSGSTVPAILAPRGEFSDGALKLKSLKKCVYLRVSRFLKLYSSVTFQASSEFERRDIVRALKVSSDAVDLAIDLPRVLGGDEGFLPPVDQKMASIALRLVFVSRIAPMKNLDFALRVLSTVRREVVFDIYGPQEDEGYWAECSSLIESIPKNVTVNYCGIAAPENVQRIFEQYDVFFFPTRGENYGHVIAESIGVGTPVLLSDQTPWSNLESDGMGWIRSLNNPGLFSELIDWLAEIPLEDRARNRAQVRRIASVQLFNSGAICENRNLFSSRLKLPSR